MSSDARLDLDAPRWDQATFAGRLKHFFWCTDSRNLFVSTKKLEESKTLVDLYKQGKEPACTTEEELWHAKRLVTSAYHPDSGELQNIIGRMSCQVPGGMIITAGMLHFYRSTSAVILWQWLNQSFNALVNYTNRNAASDMSTKQMGIAYVSATTSAVVTAVGLKRYLARHSSSLMQRFVPFVAVAAANAVNIPLSRQNELLEGVAVFDENGNQVTESKVAARKGIRQVLISRVTMAAPGMLMIPVVMETLDKAAWFHRLAWFHMPFQTLMLGGMLTLMVPVACALYPQKSSISIDELDKDKLDALMGKQEDKSSLPAMLYFNKGL